MIPAADTWGPFASNIEPGERIARLRCLRAIAHLSCGPRGVELVASLQASEVDSGALPEALAALNRLAPLDQRRIWAAYANLTAPTRRSRGDKNAEDRP
ncbi:MULTISPECIES: hypothetical protein [unclassified Methylobacterium]|uniref:hypothetical protein n=1 Tax=unclassified Methylobacterium TaxID=2615210 RepID=UPI00226AB266|nr:MULTISPECIES: hypothetical protein [unclassified Methylobacterium]